MDIYLSNVQYFFLERLSMDFPSLIKAISDLLNSNKQKDPSPPSPTPESTSPVLEIPLVPEVDNSILPPVEDQPTPKWSFVSTNTIKLTEVDFTEAASLLDVDVAAVKCVTEVESKGGGYLASNRPKILLEAHLFGRLTNQKYTSSHPHISAPKWDRSLYKGGEGEYSRLEEAMKLDEKAALCSASWGLFQILGSNHKACGFATVEDFVKANIESERSQLLAFISFVKTNKLDVHLRNKNWAEFAKKYNGPGYAANQYDVKLQNAYNKFNK